RLTGTNLLNVTGNAADNVLTGNAASNVLNGREGADTLIGGAGADTLNGGVGADRFQFAQGDSTVVAYTDTGSVGVTNGDTFAFTGGADLVVDCSQVGDSVNIKSGNAVDSAMTFMSEFAGTVVDQSVALVRGSYARGVFTANDAGVDTLLVYDGDAATGAVKQTAAVLLGVVPDQMSFSTWSDSINFTRLDTSQPNTGASFVETSPVVGTWVIQGIADEPFSTLVLLEDGRFMYGEAGGDAPNGLEAGTYTYDPLTRLLHFDVTYDDIRTDSSDGGLSEGGTTMRIDGINGDQMQVYLPDLDMSATFAQQTQMADVSDFVGIWVMQGMADEPFSTLALLDDGRFMYGEAGGDAPNGLEAGTYTYDPVTHQLHFNVTYDDILAGGADGGLSDGGTTMRIDSVDGALMQVYLPDLAFSVTFARQSSEILHGTSGDDAITSNDHGNWILGGAGADTLTGGAGHDRIVGGDGNDILAGGDGQDTFVFDTNLNASGNLDVVSDFVPLEDVFQLENGIFAALTPTGTLSADNFRSGNGVAAQDEDDFILYDTVTGALFYDQDGSGDVYEAIQFAELTGQPTIGNTDFLIA
ncbi:MAG TPA: hypothetical protein VIO81_12795, partial [Methyloversatilis sp.]